MQRSALLYLCGIVLNDIVLPVRSFPYVQFTPYLQLTGVLQKIAVCYLAATVNLPVGRAGAASLPASSV